MANNLSISDIKYPSNLIYKRIKDVSLINFRAALLNYLRLSLKFKQGKFGIKVMSDKCHESHHILFPILTKSIYLILTFFQNVLHGQPIDNLLALLFRQKKYVCLLSHAEKN